MNLWNHNFFGKYFQYSFLILIILEFLSYFGFLFPSLNILVFVLCIFTTFIISLKRLDIGVMISFAELITGSKGYLFSLPLGHFTLSLRLGIFLVLMLAWVFHAVRNKRIAMLQTIFWKPYAILLFFIALAVGVGILRGNSLSYIFLDMNGYLFFGLALPFTEALRSKKDIAHLMEIFFAATTLTMLKSLFLLFVFSQKFTLFLPKIYRWVRTTGVGEITRLDNSFFRIFFQSHIYEVFLFFLCLAFLVFPPAVQAAKLSFTDKRTRSLLIRGVFALLIIFLGYSRSFWLGVVLSLAVSYTAFLFFRVKKRRLGMITGLLLIAFLFDYAFTFALVNFPLPTRSARISAASLIIERTEDVTQEVAGASRLQLLGPLTQKALQHPIIGSGFGTTVTYKTEDPRARASSPDGLYTTYAFEWGYLDLWLKLGLFGLLSYLVFLASLFRAAWPFLRTGAHRDHAWIFGFTLGLLALSLIHGTTPYLNHPLGIGWIVFVLAALSVFQLDLKGSRAPFPSSQT